MKYAFKTNIDTIECVQRASPYLEDATGITFWHVDTAAPNKTLIVETENLSPEEVIALLRKAGFIAKITNRKALI